MLATRICKGEKVTLRQIEFSDCNENYVKWLNDPEVNQYLETKWTEQALDTIIEFVDSQRNNSHSVLFAIIENQTGMHVGNIKIGPVHPQYQHADISYFIGEKSFWGKGIASEAIQLVCEYGFQELDLHKISAGTYANAMGSQKVLVKNGFLKEGILREEIRFHDKYIDIYKYGLLREIWGERGN